MPSYNIQTAVLGGIIPVWASLVALFLAIPIQAERVSFDQQPGRVVITVDDQPMATYVFEDENIPRPYFAHVKTPSGLQVTRNFPPIEGKDATDHATMHPGIWLAFGDLDGSDFWRNKARVVHERFVVKPQGGDRHGCFVQTKRYHRADGTLVCREQFHFAVEVHDDGYLFLWDSIFDSNESFYFGDQEEMGVGFRVATPLTEKSGGRLLDSLGRVGAKSIWSKAAQWCDYSGVINDTYLGITILCHPDNFGPCWMHARDYGFCAANPFGRKAMNQGELSKVVVDPGKSLRLRYGLWIHSVDAKMPSANEASTQLQGIYQRYVTAAQAVCESNPHD